MKKILVSIVLTVCFCVPCWGALSAEDFIPVVQAKTDEEAAELAAVQNPEAVKTEKDPVLETPVTKAATTQDAINAIIQRQYKNRETGCDMVPMSYGGWAFVATGLGTYRNDMKNVVAMRISQRGAYVRAFMDAKRQMASMAKGFAQRGITNFDNKIETRDTDNPEESLRNINANDSEVQNEAVAGVLKGFVTYNVSDDFNGNVYVSIVSTPKSRGAYNRVTSDTVSAEDLASGLNAVLAEIQNGLVAPVGGRIVTVPTTGETVFVGFGSAIVRFDKDAMVRNQLLRAARASAEMRANDALAGIIFGDSILAERHQDEQTREMVQDFEVIEKEDPVNGYITLEEKKLAEGRKKEFRNALGISESIKSQRNATLPPGIRTRTWLDKNGEWAYAISMYSTSITNAAASAAKEMSETQIVKPVDPNAAPNQLKNNGARNSTTTTIRKPAELPQDSGVLNPGVSGTIIQDL